MKALLKQLNVSRLVISLSYLMLLAVISPNVASAQSCSFLILEFKVADTNRIKAGRVGIMTTTNSEGDIDVYRSHTFSERDWVNGHNCSTAQDCSQNNVKTNVTTWDKYYHPTNVSAGDVFFCSTVNGSLSQNEKIEYSNASDYCTRTMANGVWTTTNGCPTFASSCGGQNSANRQLTDTINSTMQYHGAVITNQSDCVTRSGALEQRWIVSGFYPTSELIEHLSEVTNRIDSASWGSSGSASFSLNTFGTCGSYQAMKFRYSYLVPKKVKRKIVLEARYSATLRLQVSGSQIWNTFHTNWSQIVVSNTVTGDGRVHTSQEYFIAPPTGNGIRSSLVNIVVVQGGGNPKSFASMDAGLGDGLLVGFGLGNGESNVIPGLLTGFRLS